MSAPLAAPEIERLIQLLAKLPGLGPRSARRAALAMIKRKDQVLLPLGAAIAEVARAVRVCEICGNLDAINPCTICADQRRDRQLLCVVADVGDVWALERAGVFRGRYHILGGTLSVLDGRGPEQLNIGALASRVGAQGVKEVVLALNATVEGQTTAHYVTDLLSHLGVAVTKLAQGLPVGGELDYLDDGTLAAAFGARRPF
jgi:recombination protein RecR